MVRQSYKNSPVSDRVRSTVEELGRIDGILRTDEMDSRVLTDFRDALDRVRNTAWSVHQYVSRKETGEDSKHILATLAAGRVRAAFRLCQALQADMDANIRFQPGQLLQLHSAVEHLAERLGRVVKEMDQRCVA